MEHKIDIDQLHENYLSTDTSKDGRTGKTYSQCHELLSCVCFGDKKIICKVSYTMDIDYIIEILKQLVDEYEIATFGRVSQVRYNIEDSEVLFYPIGATIHGIDNFTLIDFTR